MLTKEQILGALPKLERPDLEAIHAVTGSLLGAATGVLTKPASPLALTTFAALAGAVASPMPYASFNATSAARKFDAYLPDMTAFLNVQFSGWDKNKVSQQAFLTMLFGLLADDLKSRGVAPTLGIMVVNLKRLPEVFDNAFPNYREAGLGKMILKRFQ